MPIQTIQYINIGTSPNDGTGDTLRAGGNKINLDLEYIDGLLNNRISFITVTVDWSQSVVSQLRDYVNANPMTVEKDELVIFLMYKNISNDPMSLQLQQYRYLWVLGEGAFGGTNPIATNAFFNLGYVGGENESVYDLGEIGTSNIEDVVNQSGPYSLNSGATVVFQAERSGELVSYLYTGPTGTVIGLGEYQTIASEYTDLTNQQPVPPDLSSFVEFQDLDQSLYDKATPGFSTDINNFTSLTDPFYLLEDTTANKHYFASKQTNVESMEGARIYIRETGTHHDLVSPTLTQNGYYFWDLGNLGITINSLSEPFAFGFWIRNAGGDVQGVSDASLYLDPVTGLLRANVSTFSEEWTFTTGDPQTKTLAFEPTNFLVVSVNGQEKYSDEYTYVSPDQFTFNDLLENGDRVRIIYERFITQP